MDLIITNQAREPETIASPDGSYADLLQPGSATSVQGDDQVLVIGDKPNVREQISRGFEVIAGAAKAVFDVLARRREQVSAQTGEAMVVDVHITNGGAKAVRAVLGDGQHEAVIQPGTSQAVAAKGYIELRELGDLDEAQLDGGQQLTAT